MAINKRIIKSNDEGGGGLTTSFNTVLYTGTGSQITRTDVGFQPDLVWIKSRENTWDHFLTNSITNGALRSNRTLEESPNPDFLFNSDGFTTPVGGSWTESGKGYVAWCWKAGGTAVTNTDGDLTSQVSANPEAGFSIVTLTIPNDNTQSVGHGLDTAPSVIIMKARDSQESWLTYHSSVGLGKYLLLNSTAAEASYTGIWSNVNSSTFTTLYHSAIGSPTRNVIAYCFAEVAGFSQFGSYTGNGSTSGPTIDCGFEPAFVMIKASSAISADRGVWVMKDNKRDTTNPNSANLYANLSNDEDTASVADVNFLYNGFQPAGNYEGINESGKTYIYMAFANQF